MADTIDHTGTKTVVCPWCGHTYQDCSEWGTGQDEDMEEMECGDCGNDFIWERSITTEYSTNRKKCKTCNYELSMEPYIFKGHNWTIYECIVCEHNKIKKTAQAEDGEPYIEPLEAASVA